MVSRTDTLFLAHFEAITLQNTNISFKPLTEKVLTIKKSLVNLMKIAF